MRSRFADANELLANEARRLRVEGHSVAEIQSRLGITKHTLTTWLAGTPVPDSLRRPNAKDELRARAAGLRADGWSVNDIALELGVARSTAWSWVKDMPLDRDSERARQKAEHAKLMIDGRWARHRDARDAAQADVHRGAAALVGDLSERDVMLMGAIAYWCEGSKSKPWRREERLRFINSDPGLLKLYLGFLAAIGVERDRLTFRVSIHETADPAVAAAWWRNELGLDDVPFHKPTIKRHKPLTTRRNVEADYHGCLLIEVNRSQRFYWMVEGTMAAITAAVRGGM